MHDDPIGKCEDVPVQQNFNATRYLGIWYELYRFKGSPFESNSTCDRANYTLNPTNPGHITVVNSAREGGPQGKYVAFIGDATIPDPKQPAKLLVRFPQTPFPYVD